MARQEWGFHYSGPLSAKPDMNCVTCRAENTKTCPTHATGFAQGCAHCDAAQGKGCQSHWGLKAALEHFGNHIVDADAKSDFEAAKVVALAETTKKQNVRVNMRGDGDLLSTDHREVHIEIQAYR